MRDPARVGYLVVGRRDVRIQLCARVLSSERAYSPTFQAMYTGALVSARYALNGARTSTRPAARYAICPSTLSSASAAAGHAPSASPATMHTPPSTNGTERGG